MLRRVTEVFISSLYAGLHHTQFSVLETAIGAKNIPLGRRLIRQFVYPAIMSSLIVFLSIKLRYKAFCSPFLQKNFVHVTERR